MVRQLAVIGLQLMGAALHAVADWLNDKPVEEDLVEAELPEDGTPLTAEARGMIVPRPIVEKPRPEPPPEGSVAARLANVRSFG